MTGSVSIILIVIFLIPRSLPYTIIVVKNIPYLNKTRFYSNLVDTARSRILNYDGDPIEIAKLYGMYE